MGLLRERASIEKQAKVATKLFIPQKNLEFKDSLREKRLIKPNNNFDAQFYADITRRT